MLKVKSSIKLLHVFLLWLWKECLKCLWLKKKKKQWCTIESVHFFNHLTWFILKTVTLALSLILQCTKNIKFVTRECLTKTIIFLPFSCDKGGNIGERFQTSKCTQFFFLKKKEKKRIGRNNRLNSQFSFII